MIAGDVEHVGPHRPILLGRDLGSLPRQPLLGDDIDGDVIFEDLDILLLTTGLGEGSHNLTTGEIVRVEDAPMAVPPLPVEAVFGTFARPGELDTQRDQILHARWPRANRELNGLPSAQPRPGHQGVSNVVVEVIVIGPDRGDSTLRIRTIR